MFEAIIGNEKAKHYLTSVVAKGTIGSSFLFSGPDGIGKSLFAKEFTKLVLCLEDPSQEHKRKIEAGVHPDIHVYKPEGKIGMHSIFAMRQFCEEVYLAPFEAKWKVFIIEEADRMLSYSANALLKTFEEPPKNTLIILLSSNPEALLPTVLSRCRKIHFHPLSESEIREYFKVNKIKPECDINAIAAMSQGSIAGALKYAMEGGCPIRKNVLDILSIGKFNHYKELTNAAKHIAEAIEEKKKEVEDQLRLHLQNFNKSDLNAVQKQTLEKEIEGALMMQTMKEAKHQFFVILAWYRDMHLIAVNGNIKWLLHHDFREECLQAYERGLSLPLDTVQKAIDEAVLSIERSTGIAISFENLFLKLKMI